MSKCVSETLERPDKLIKCTCRLESMSTDADCGILCKGLGDVVIISSVLLAGANEVWISTEPTEKGNKSSNVHIFLSLFKEEFINLRGTCNHITRLYIIMIQVAIGVYPLHLNSTFQLRTCVKNHLR